MAEAWASVWWWAAWTVFAVNVGLTVYQFRVVRTFWRLNDLWLDLLVFAYLYRQHVQLVEELEQIRRRHMRRMLGRDF